MASPQSVVCIPIIPVQALISSLCFAGKWMTVSRAMWTPVSPTLGLGGSSQNVHHGGQVRMKQDKEASRALGRVGNWPRER